MAVDLTGRHFLKELDFTPEEFRRLVDAGRRAEGGQEGGHRGRSACAGRNIALIFEKTSTRTRCSFEVAAADQGASTTYLDPSGSQIGHKESVQGHRPGARPDVRRHRVPRATASPSSRSWPRTPACRSATA